MHQETQGSDQDGRTRELEPSTDNRQRSTDNRQRSTDNRQRTTNNQHPHNPNFFTTAVTSFSVERSSSVQ